MAALGDENSAKKHGFAGGFAGLPFSFSPKIRRDSLRYGC
jgi:hypothetical protein